MSKKAGKQSTPSDVEIALKGALDKFKAEATDGVKEAVAMLEIGSVKEIQAEGKSCAVVTVPYKQIRTYKALNSELVQRFEAAINGETVFIVGKRRAFPKRPEPGRRYRQIRPVSRTLRSVQEKVLEDIAFPTAIVGKRTHYDLKGKQTTRVILDNNNKDVEMRLPAMSAAYSRLTGLRTVFELETA